MPRPNTIRPVSIGGNSGDYVAWGEGLRVCDDAMLIGRRSGAVTTSSYPAEGSSRRPCAHAAGSSKSPPSGSRLAHSTIRQSGYHECNCQTIQGAGFLFLMV